MRDLYTVLQVAPEASDTEIKSAFRSLAKACHPDMRPGDRAAEAAFQEAQRAYQFLSNPETRKAYDAYLAGRRAAERARRRRAAATMSASFVLTAGSVLLVSFWLHQGGLPLGRTMAAAVERSEALDLVRTPARAEGRQLGADDFTLPAGPAATP